MTDLINRHALLTDIEDAILSIGRYGQSAEILGANKIIDLIRFAPTVDAEPVKHGRWIGKNSPYDVNIYICSICKKQVSILGNKLRYCPNCGAKMDGERKDGNRDA